MIFMVRINNYKTERWLLTFDLLLEPRADNKPNEDAGDQAKADGNEQPSPPFQLIESQHCSPIVHRGKGTKWGVEGEEGRKGKVLLRQQAACATNNTNSITEWTGTLWSPGC